MQKILVKILSDKKINEPILTSLLLFCCLIFFFLFPIKDQLQNGTALIFFFFLVPFIFFKIILKKSFAELGWQIGDWKKGVLFSILSLLIFFGIFLLLFYKTHFTDYYIFSNNLRNDFLIFIFREIIFALFSLSLFEIFFRGFVMLSFAPKIGAWSILLQFLVFLLLLFFLKSFSWQNLLLIFSAVFSGVITYQSRSLFYSYATTFIFLLLCNAYIIKFVIQ